MHEKCNPEGCEFAEVMSHTPGDLLENGLYNDVATPLHEGLHRAVSLLIAAKAMGAVNTNRGVSQKRTEQLQKAKGLMKLGLSKPTLSRLESPMVRQHRLSSDDSKAADETFV